MLEPPDADDAAADALPTAQAARLGVPAYRGMRTLDYLYVEYATGEKELYDLKNDPDQLQNLAAKTDAAVLAKLVARLAKLKKCAAAACRAAEDAPVTK